MQAKFYPTSDFGIKFCAWSRGGNSNFFFVLSNTPYENIMFSARFLPSSCMLINFET